MATQHLTWLNHREEIHPGETNNEPSMTQPDEVLSIREILINHSRGIPQHVREGMYYDEDQGYIPELEGLDLTEIEDLRDHYAMEADKLQKSMEAADQAAKKLQEEKAAAEKEEKEFLKSLRNNKKSGEADKPIVSDGQ